MMALKERKGCHVFLLMMITTSLGFSYSQVIPQDPTAYDFHRVRPVSTRGALAETARFSSVADDPEFSAPNGVAFEFEGENNTTFCLTSDQNLHINAMLSGYRDRRNTSKAAAAGGAQKLASVQPQLRTWIKQLAFLWVDKKTGKAHSFRLVAKTLNRTYRGKGFLSGVQVDGRTRRFTYGRPLVGGGLSFSFVGAVNVTQQNVTVVNTTSGNATNVTVPLQQEVFSLQIDGLLEATVILLPAVKGMQQPNNTQVHFNLNLWKLYNSPQIHGILGQLYRTDKASTTRFAPFVKAYKATKVAIKADQASGKGFLEGSVKDYVSSNLVRADCKFTQFMKKGANLVTSKDSKDGRTKQK